MTAPTIHSRFIAIEIIMKTINSAPLPSCGCALSGSRLRLRVATLPCYRNSYAFKANLVESLMIAHQDSSAVSVGVACGSGCGVSVWPVPVRAGSWVAMLRCV